MKITDERKMKNNNNNKNNNNSKTKQTQKETKRDPSYSGSVRADFNMSMSKSMVLLCVYYAVRFFQLICKASLIFKSKLEFALAINLKERELCESKHFVVKCGCLKL